MSSLQDQVQSGGGLQKSQSVVMDMKEMYSIATRQNTAWGIDGYQVPKQYLDADKIKREKEIAEFVKTGKPVPSAKLYITKKRNFIDDELRLKNKAVGPNSYKLKDVWDTLELEQKKPKPKFGNRQTFIDGIFLEQKRRAVPGPGKYKIEKDEKDLKELKEKLDGQQKTRKNNQGDLPNYLNDFEYLGASTPGPGFYNDRLKDSLAFDIEQKKLRTNYYKVTPAEWSKKHKEEVKKITKKDNLEAIDPIHQDFNTFDKTVKDLKKSETTTAKNLKFFGSLERFPDPKKSKSKSILITPSPSNYNLMALWKGKEQKDQKEKHKPLDYHRITKGIEKSIYY